MDEMKIRVDEVPYEKNKNICIRLSGDITFVSSNHSLNIYLDEESANKISFHIESILQDRQRKGLTNNQSVV